MTEAENVHHKMGNGGTRISPSLIYVSEIDFRELKHKTRIFDTRTFSFPTHFPALLSRDFLNSRGTYIYSLLISIVKYMYKRPSLWISIVKYMYKRPCLWISIVKYMYKRPSLWISIGKYMYKRPSLLISIVKNMYKRPSSSLGQSWPWAHFPGGIRSDPTFPQRDLTDGQWQLGPHRRTGVPHLCY